MDLDAEIQEATTGITNQPEVESTEEVAPVEQENEVEQKPETEESPDESDSKPNDFVPFPKKAKEAISRRDRQINKLRAEYQALQQEVQKLQQTPQQNQSSGDKSDYPREDDYSTFTEYREAVARHEAESKYKAELTKQQQEFQQQQNMAQQQAWQEERLQTVAQKATDYRSKHPEVAQALDENLDIVDSYPPQIQQAFLEADDAPLAFYALAREGMLEQLAELSPSRAAMEIAKAELRGKAMLQPKVSNAPSPIKPNKGTGGFSKSVDQMTPDELDKWLTAI